MDSPPIRHALVLVRSLLLLVAAGLAVGALPGPVPPALGIAIVAAFASIVIFDIRPPAPAAAGAAAAPATREAIEAAVAARTRELQRLYDESVAVSRTKNEFVANMSHELRTPLNIIIGYTDMLRDESSRPDAAEADRLMGRVRTAAANLLQLVDMVLDLGKLEAGKVPVRSTSLALTDFADELARRERIRPAAGVTFRCDAEPDLPVIETDAGKLTMILDNLISNAIKFTRTGAIVTRVAHRREQACVEFEVEDTGPGIDPRHLSTIFEPFHQLERSADNPFGGFGLGLAIVHRYVQLLGGTITVRSTLDVGTCFTVRLPYASGYASATGVARHPGRPHATPRSSSEPPLVA